MRILFLLMLIFSSIPTYAGLTEVSASGTYRQNSFGVDETTEKKRYSTFRSYTASLAYYFWTQSAIEMSYTRARTDEVQTQYEARTYIDIYGLDFILTLAAQGSTFVPYIKLGVTYQDKVVFFKQPDQDPIELPRIKGYSPSAGFGFKLAFDEHFSLRVGIEAWTSPDKGDNQLDFSGRAGLSWMF